MVRSGRNNIEDPGSYKTKSPGRPGRSAYTLAGRSNDATLEPDDGFGCSYHWIAKTMATTRMTPVVSIKISAASYRLTICLYDMGTLTQVPDNPLIVEWANAAEL
jgi:hypothetical protein